MSQLCHALSGVLRQHLSMMPMSAVTVQKEATLLFVLELCLTAVQAIPEFKSEQASRPNQAYQTAGFHD